VNKEEMDFWLRVVQVFMRRNGGTVTITDEELNASGPMFNVANFYNDKTMTSHLMSI